MELNDQRSGGREWGRVFALDCGCRQCMHDGCVMTLLVVAAAEELAAEEGHSET